MNTEETYDKVILAGIYEAYGPDTYDDFLHAMEELTELTKACLMEPTASVTQTLDRQNTALYMGAGKVMEIRDQVEDTGAVRVIFNDTLSPIQIRNLQKELGVDIMDRTGLILEIFRSRARTREAKLQVELARLSYLKPRLIGMWEKQNRQGGASGSMSSKGEGETQLEIDRRTIDHRLAQLRRELKVVDGERATQRKKRKNSGIPLVSLVGYTNAGKSTLMNAFVRAYANAEKQVFEADMLFATLDTTVRRIDAGARQAFLLSDTVGFIQKLPTGLVEAFNSTLEEVRDADLILQVADYSDPHYKDQMATTARTIADLGAGSVPVLTVYNKCDLQPGTAYPRKGPDFRTAEGRLDHSIYISAREPESLQALTEAILEELYGPEIEETRLIAYADGAELSRIMASGTVLSQEYEEDGIRITVRRRSKEVRTI